MDSRQIVPQFRTVQNNFILARRTPHLLAGADQHIDQRNPRQQTTFSIGSTTESANGDLSALGVGVKSKGAHHLPTIE